MRKDNLSKKLLITSVGYKHNITKHATCLSEKEKNQKKNKIIFKLEIQVVYSIESVNAIISIMYCISDKNTH